MKLYDSPFQTPEDNLLIASGVIEHQTKIIDNLRQQIVALRNSLIYYGMCESSIDNIQYAHLKDKS